MPPVNPPYYQNPRPNMPIPTPNLNPYQEVDFTPVENRTKTIPVSKWPMRYAGEDRGAGLNTFLWEVNDWTQSELISESELLRSFGNLLTGKAKMWFMSNKHRFTTYSELMESLKATFRHPDLDHFVLLEIHQRRQQKNESFLEFFLDVERKFKSLAKPVSEEEIAQAVRRNLRPDYKRALIGREFADLMELQMAGQEIDATNTYLFSKPHGHNSQTNAIKAEGKPPFGNNNNRKGGQTSQESQKDSNQQRKFSSNRPNQGSSSSNQQGKQPSQKDQSRSYQEKKSFEPKKTEKKNTSDCEPQESSPVNDVSKGVEAQLRSHFPMNDKFVCFNCRSQQHLTDQCSQPYKIHCQVCGFQGFPTHRCPYCSKNGQRQKDRGPLK